jgi:hypothetical protein
LNELAHSVRSHTNFLCSRDGQTKHVDTRNAYFVIDGHGPTGSESREGNADNVWGKRMIPSKCHESNLYVPESVMSG